MSKNLTIASVIIALALIGGVFILGKNKTGAESNVINNVLVNNVSVVDGKQIIEIRAKGGYTPKKSIAKAGIPTILRFNTNGTFDCSSFVRIPSMNIGQSLAQSGTTDIDLGTQQVATLQGTCGMGMYPFEIDFQ
jgi:plastocyanin domain-containing protein